MEYCAHDFRSSILDAESDNQETSLVEFDFRIDMQIEAAAEIGEDFCPCVLSSLRNDP